MTTEEKARAYDEALTTAKRIISENCSEVEKLCLKCVFPELAESDDERIRKALVEYFAPPVSFTTVRGIPVQKVRDWLEKQKENPDRLVLIGKAKSEKQVVLLAESNGDENIYWDTKSEEDAVSLLEKGLKFFGMQKPTDLSDMMVHKEPCIAPVPTPMVADEQKPAECIDFYDEFYKVYTGPKNILAYVNIFVKKLGYVPIDIHELSACVYYVIKHIEEDTKASQKEQKPSEWSEEDEAAWGDLMWCIEQARKSAKDENDMGNIWFAENWVKNRLKSLRPQPSSQPNINHTVWHNASEEKPTKLPIIHIWYHGNRVNAVTHEDTCLQAELDDINFQPDDKWAYVEDLLNAQPHWKPSEEH